MEGGWGRAAWGTKALTIAVSGQDPEAFERCRET